MTTKWVCSDCGSDDILQDAWVDLNYGDVVDTFDSYYCRECDGECGIKLVEVDDEE